MSVHDKHESIRSDVNVALFVHRPLEKVCDVETLTDLFCGKTFRGEMLKKNRSRLRLGEKRSLSSCLKYSLLISNFHSFQS